MKTQLEIQTKVEQLKSTQVAYTNVTQVHIIDAEIGCLNWVLGIEPDHILIPRP